jgi:hypothetical protein
MTDDPFRRELVALDRALGGAVPLIIGGGYGLVLREGLLRAARARTRRAYPSARSTEDIDLFLKLELLLDPARAQRFREALDGLGYVPVESAKYYQFVRKLAVRGGERSMKIDLLARVPESAEEKKAAKADTRRVRSRSFGLLHAHATPEAITVEENLVPLRIRSGGGEATVYLPHPFSYLLLKLFALRDLLENAAKGYGRHHAADLFATVAMLTAEEWHQTVSLRERYAGTAVVVEVRRIADELFRGRSAAGVQRLADHFAALGERIALDELDAFCDDLRVLLGIGPAVDLAYPRA